jgi:hypothetical protein
MSSSQIGKYQKLTPRTTQHKFVGKKFIPPVAKLEQRERVVITGDGKSQSFFVFIPSSK